MSYCPLMLIFTSKIGRKSNFLRVKDQILVKAKTRYTEGKFFSNILLRIYSLEEIHVGLLRTSDSFNEGLPIKMT